jgi:hypothetical protein
MGPAKAGSPDRRFFYSGGLILLEEVIVSKNLSFVRAIVPFQTIRGDVVYESKVV